MKPLDAQAHSPYERWIAWLILSVALILRILFISFAAVNVKEGGDQSYYMETAANILHTGIHTSSSGDAYRPPLYPFVMSLIFRFVGESRTAVYGLQAVMGAVTAALVYRLLCRMGRQTAVVGGLMVAIHPLMLYYTKQVLSETLYALLLVLTVLCFPGLIKGERSRLMAAGVVMGLAVLTRAEALGVGALLALGILIWGHGALPERIKALVVAAFVALLVVCPWLIRNSLRLGSPSLGNSAGITFYMGNNPKATGTYYYPDAPVGLPLGEADQNNFYWQQGAHWVLSNPVAFVSRIPKKESITWGGQNQLVLNAADLMMLPFLLLGAGLSLRNSSERPVLFALACPIVSVAVITAMSIGLDRYRAPAYPFLLAFAAVGLIAVYKAARTRFARA